MTSRTDGDRHHVGASQLAAPFSSRPWWQAPDGRDFGAPRPRAYRPLITVPVDDCPGLLRPMRRTPTAFAASLLCALLNRTGGMP